MHKILGDEKNLYSKIKDANTQCSGFAKQNFETHVLTRVFQGAVQKSTIFELLNPFFFSDKYYGH